MKYLQTPRSRKPPTNCFGETSTVGRTGASANRCIRACQSNGIQFNAPSPPLPLPAAPNVVSVFILIRRISPMPGPMHHRSRKLSNWVLIENDRKSFKYKRMRDNFTHGGFVSSHPSPPANSFSRSVLIERDSKLVN